MVTSRRAAPDGSVTPTRPLAGCAATWACGVRANTVCSVSWAASTVEPDRGPVALAHEPGPEPSSVPWARSVVGVRRPRRRARAAARRGPGGRDVPRRRPPRTASPSPARRAPASCSAATPGPRARQAPGRSKPRSRAPGVSTCASTLRTTVVPLTSLIHSSGAHGHPVPEDRAGDGLDVLGHDVVPAGDHGVRPGGQHQREGAARRGAHHHLRVLTGGRRERDAVATHALLDRDGLDGRLHPQETGGVGDGVEVLRLLRAGRAGAAGRPTPGPGSGSRTTPASGTGRAGPRAAGRCLRTPPGSRWPARGRAPRAGRSAPSTVTCPSCIASSSAAWVFGGVRLISSASSRPVNSGPGRNSNSERFWL